MGWLRYLKTRQQDGGPLRKCIFIDLMIAARQDLPKPMKMRSSWRFLRRRSGKYARLPGTGNGYSKSHRRRHGDGRWCCLSGARKGRREVFRPQGGSNQRRIRDGHSPYQGGDRTALRTYWVISFLCEGLAPTPPISLRLGTCSRVGETPHLWGPPCTSALTSASGKTPTFGSCAGQGPTYR